MLKPFCEYPCPFHRGKIDWHHPVNDQDFGFYLCEAHHSILMGRKRRYPGECLVDKSLEQMRQELQDMETKLLTPYGLKPNKH